jgi:hypothetical protein
MNILESLVIRFLLPLMITVILIGVSIVAFG